MESAHCSSNGELATALNELVVGVDGGGTKTVARLLARGAGGRLCVLATGRAGPSNPNSVGWDAAAEAIVAACRAAHGQPALAAVVAVAGCAAEPARRRMVEALVTRDLAERVDVVSDTAPLAAHLPCDQPVVALIAGTGSAALARGGDGVSRVVGGWGYLVDDAGSGFGLGRSAIRHAGWRIDAGEPPDALTDAALRHADATGSAGVKAALYNAPSPRGWLAALAPEVLRLASAGDPAATAAAEENADALVDLAGVARVASRTTGAQAKLLLAGGLLEGSAWYRRVVTRRLAAAGWPADQIALAPDAACNCGLLACRLIDQQDPVIGR